MALNYLGDPDKKTRSISFLLTGKDYLAFKNLKLYNPSELFRSVVKALITKDQEMIQELDRVLGLRIDDFGIYREHTPGARPWISQNVLELSRRLEG